MSVLKFAAALAVAVPAIALAQVGPNPAVNGSLDPTVGPTNDAATAPDDAAVGNDTMSPGNDATPSDVVTNDSSAATAGDNTTDAVSEAKKTTAPTSESRRKPR